MRQVIFKNEIDFNKKLRALKKYCPKAHKYLYFDIFTKDLFEKKKGSYEIELPTSKEFKMIYGQIKLKYSIHNRKIILEDLEPNAFLIDGYKFELESYKGIFYRNEKDIFNNNNFCINIYIYRESKSICKS